MLLRIFFLMCLLPLGLAQGSPFPIKGEIYDGQNQRIGTAHVYPRYVEIYDQSDQQLGRVGILVENGIARLFLVRGDNQRKIAGYASGGKIFNNEDQLMGTYFWTPTYSFVYHLDGSRAGRVKCIAWPRVCAVGVGGYLLKLFGANDEISP